MHPPTTPEGGDADPFKQVDRRTVALQPEERKTVRLGIFQYTEAEPRFTIDYHSEGPHVVTHHKTRLERGSDEYELAYQFQNFDDRQHVVTVQRQRPR